MTADADLVATITCQACGTAIPISEALHHELTTRAEERVRQEVARRERALATREAALQAREGVVEAAASKVEADIARKLAEERETLKAREAAVRNAEAELDARVTERVGAERAALEESIRVAMRADVDVEIRDLKAAAQDADRRLRDAQRLELQLRKEKRELEAQKEALTLDVARRVDAERNRVRQDALRQAEEEHRLKDAEKDQKLRDAIRMNEELRRKLQQGSQQAQGEALEEVLEDALRSQFSLDVFEPVSKGTRGADVIQRVYTRSGQRCGAILWESKNTKNWSDSWVDKVKDDQRAAKADVAVIVSAALPKGVSGFAFREGVWVAEARVAVGLATALRHGLIELAATKRAVAGKNEAVEVLFTYLTGPEFHQRVEAIVRTFSDMQGDLEEEKRVAARRWAKREKQLSRVIESTGGMYGDLQGLLGSSMPAIAALDAGDEEEAPFEDPQPVPDDDDIPF